VRTIAHSQNGTRSLSGFGLRRCLASTNITCPRAQGLFSLSFVIRTLSFVNFEPPSPPGRDAPNQSQSNHFKPSSPYAFAHEICTDVFWRSSTALWRSFTTPVRSAMKRYAALRTINCPFLLYAMKTRFHQRQIQNRSLIVDHLCFLRYLLFKTGSMLAIAPKWEGWDGMGLVGCNGWCNGL
jgi:hypothetical protein